jgi:hypothetical protein
VFTETAKSIDEAGLKLASLTRWTDVDEFDDLIKFYKRNKNLSAESRVMQFLITKGIMNESKL